MWLAERNTYDQIKALKFFTKFRKWKTLKQWKRKIMQDRINKCQDELMSKLFWLSDAFRPVLLEVRSNTYDLEELRMVTFHSKQSLNSSNTFDLEEFMQLQEENRKSVKAGIQAKSVLCRDIVKRGFTRSIEGLKKEEETLRRKDE